MLSAMTKSLAKRVPSLSPAHSVSSEKPSQQGASGSAAVSPTSETIENLEESMHKV